MIRRGLATTLIVLVMATAATAQTPARLRWQPNQVLVYRAEQATQALEVVGETKIDSRTRLNLTKRWQVIGVDAAGVATLQLSVLALRMETTTPSGDVLVFDSDKAHIDKSTPELREQLAKFVGPPLALLRVDALGRVLEVKESKFGPPSRFENELPFVGVLPGVVPQVGQAWERPYKITLEPPQGAGEKYDAVQKYVWKSVAAASATVAVKTELKQPPETPADQAPLLQMQPEGEIVFDLQAGRLKSATLRIDKEVKGHQGEGSSYHFLSSYTEQYVGDR
jgi:hypothetical protein